MDSAYLALDPGETTGWAEFDADGKLLQMGQFKQADQNKFLAKHVHSELKVVIIEDYRNYGWEKQKRWSRNQTSKNIGAIEMICGLRNVQFVLQPANIKAIGYKWSGLGGAPTNHSISHQYDAYVHGVYYLQSENVVPPGFYLNLNDPA